MSRINFDALGIITSIACAIHCAVLPLLLSSLPLFGINIINNNLFETGMILLALAIGIFSLWNGVHRHHRRLLPVVLFVLGISLLFAKQYFHHRFLLWLLVPAVILIISAHLLNYVYCARSDAHDAVPQEPVNAP
jgi:hypothetical protein